MNDRKLIEALRCSITPHSIDEEMPCGGCPYYRFQPLPEEEVGLLTEDFYCGCDVDAMAQDAADRLEELTRRESKYLCERCRNGKLEICKYFVENYLEDGGAVVRCPKFEEDTDDQGEALCHVDELPDRPEQ